MVLDAFMSSLSRVVLTMVQDKVSVLLGVPGELDKLSRTIGDVRYVLSDAERKQSESYAISRWVMELKDLMYDTDDFLELCQIKADERRDSVASSCCCFGYLVMNPGFACRIGRRIRELNSRMDGIVKKISLLGLVEDRADFRLVQSIVSLKTDPMIVQSDIVGEKIEENCDNLMDLLTKEDGANVKENMVVVAIVGVGGIGKTTLAKRVFNDQRIKDEFHVKIWVCISKEIVERDLLKNIIREVGGHHGDAEERSELLPILEKLISRKKFFLVLDDVWRESEQSCHGLLRDPLMSGAYGSRILVTTRDQTVATRMRAVHSLHVDKLPNEDAWSLLAKQVVLGGEEREIKHLKGIGFEILKKCNGLPLAIKVLGGVLCTKNKTESEWQAVLLNNLWSARKLPDDIHVSLYLGYEDLPAQLKQCFVFCSLYPEDWEFNSDDLANFWRAQGLLQTERASSVCDLGMEYYNELVLRNLLEPNRNFYDPARCKMHDLLRLFARYLARNESFLTTEAMNLSSRASPIKLRHLAIKEKDVVVDLLKKQESLRTLLMIQHATINLGSILDSLSSLRVLVISFSKISSLPNSLCRLLPRWLNVETTLHNLRYLMLANCATWQFIALGRLSNLDILRIKSAHSVTIVGNEFIKGVFPRLEQVGSLPSPSLRENTSAMQ
ncbi:hypothetical protein LUZ60_012631 [Juncus effusus]|nr:hypothetical protein LUZ60_012631 [Juncus effusus]